MKRSRYLLTSFVLLGYLLNLSCSGPPATTSQPVGVAPKTLFFIELSFPSGAYSQPQQRSGFVQQILSRIRALAEVESAAISTSQKPREVIVESFETVKPIHIYSAVTPDYFRVLKLELLKGRLVLEHDGPGSPNIAILSESAARKLIHETMDPIGKRISISQKGERNSWLEIVGVVTDEQESSDRPRTEIYEAYNQDPGAALDLIVRAKSETPTLAEKLKEEILAVDKQVTVSKIQSK